VAGQVTDARTLLELVLALDPATAQRLAFIRYLYEQGVAQAEQPEPLSATAVLSFHDAVEAFLLVAAEHLKINLPNNINFAQYWERIQSGLPPGTQLPGKNPMDRMNRMRVALKHHGTIPSATAVVQAKGDVTSFLTDSINLVFALDFARIDLIDMVARTETVDALRDAQTHADREDYVAGMAGLVIAFDDLLEHYAGLRDWSGDSSKFGFGRTLSRSGMGFRRSYHSFRGSGFSDLADLAETLDHVTDVASELQRAMRMIALGIDYRRYAQFEILAPSVDHFFGGKIEYRVSALHENLTQDDFQTAKLFVIDSALQAAKADAALDAVTRHIEAHQPKAGKRNSATSREWKGSFGSSANEDEV
jgi:hypothetical protein